MINSAQILDIINNYDNKNINIGVLGSHSALEVMDGAENEFLIPIFGNRYLLRAEERTAPKNQYYLLNKSKIKHPQLHKPQDISGPSIVKVQEAKRNLE